VQPFFVKNWFSGALTNVLLKDKVDVIFLLSSKDNNFILQEAQKLNIPVIALVDSDTSSNMVTFPIWANDNSLELQHFVTKFISDTIIETQLMTYGLDCV
jgi:small subunit ribosomal protein S2